MLDRKYSFLNGSIFVQTFLRSTKPSSKEKIFYTEDLYYKKRNYAVNKFLYQFLLIPKKLCLDDLDIVILVHSEQSKVERRKALRQTWGSLALNSISYSLWPKKEILKYNFNLYFVFGLSKDEGLNDMISEENDKYGDIIQGNFIDHYRNMTLKSILGLKFIKEKCNNVRYFIKSDSDVFLNLPYLTQYLFENPMSYSILGPLCVGSKVYRKGKWGISFEDFPFETYPVYEAGSAYIISSDLVDDLYAASEFVPYIFIDDVYITGILGRILNATHLNVPGFAYWTTTSYKTCDLLQHKVFSITNLNHKIIRHIWKELFTIRCS